MFVISDVVCPVHCNYRGVGMGAYIYLYFCSIPTSSIVLFSDTLKV